MLGAGQPVACIGSVFGLADPFFPLSFLVNSWFPGMLDDLFQSVFLCALLLFWLCVYHGIRVQVSFRKTRLSFQILMAFLHVSVAMKSFLSRLHIMQERPGYL